MRKSCSKIFSLDSRKHIDVYLEALHGEPARDDDETVRVVPRCGACAGEVIRKNPPGTHKVAFKEMVRYWTFAKGLEYSVATGRR